MSLLRILWSENAAEIVLIHYHDTFYVGEQERRVREIFDPLCDYEILGIREVKSFAPSVSHYVADLRILSRSPRSR